MRRSRRRRAPDPGGSRRELGVGAPGPGCPFLRVGSGRAPAASAVVAVVALLVAFGPSDVL
ncbi:hypothetical protein [Streptomyces mirabilis]|uniref:hypothetical protein n=1 Tax=Streptomyces mirabilis TaxID=68239 RepID=UPI00368CAD22